MHNINEPIELEAHFSEKGSLKPLSFTWRRRFYEVDEITSLWKDSLGGAQTVNYTLVAQGTLFEILFHTRDLTWSIKRIAPLN